jgi:hypothetical protein
MELHVNSDSKVRLCQTKCKAMVDCKLCFLTSKLDDFQNHVKLGFNQRLQDYCARTTPSQSSEPGTLIWHMC